jgi:hypothetical protein
VVDVDLYNTKATGAGLKELQIALPQCNVSPDVRTRPDEGEGRQWAVTRKRRSLMRFTSRWALASIASLPVAGVVHLLGWLESERMVAVGEGWEMAFYWSPMVSLAIDGVLILGGIAGLIGLAVGPGAFRRLQAGAGALVCAGSFIALPWR